MFIFQRYFHKKIITEVDLPNKISVIVGLIWNIYFSISFPDRREILYLFSNFIGALFFSATVMQNFVFFNLLTFVFDVLLNLRSDVYLSLIYHFIFRIVIFYVDSFNVHIEGRSVLGSGNWPRIFVSQGESFLYSRFVCIIFAHSCF